MKSRIVLMDKTNVTLGTSTVAGEKVLQVSVVSMTGGGDATAANQVIGNASLSSINTKLPSGLTVSATRLLVDGSGVTQPVSGTFWQATQPISGSVSVSNFPATQAVTQSGTWTTGRTWTLSSGTDSIAAVQSGTWTVTQGTSPWVTSDTATNISAATAATRGMQVMGVFNTTPTTLTNGQSGFLQLDSAENLLVNLKTAIPTGANTIGAVTQASGPWSQNLTQVLGAAVSVTNPVPMRLSDGTGYISSSVRGTERYLETVIKQDDVISGNNSSTANINSMASFTGTSDEISGYSVAFIAFKSDQVCTLTFEQSTDNVNWDIDDVWTTIANTGESQVVLLTARYFRVVVANNTAFNTTFLRLQTTYMAVSGPFPRTLTSSGNFKVSIAENSTTFTFGGPVPNSQITGLLQALNDQTTFSNNGYDVIVVNISGTWVGTISFFGVPDAGTNVAIQAQVLGTEQIVTTTTTNGNFQLNISGFNTVNIKMTSYTSGISLIFGTVADGPRIPTTQVVAGSASSTVLGLQVSRQTALTNTAVAVKASAGRVYGYHYSNSSGSTDSFVHFYDVASGSVVVGTTTPKRSLCIPAGMVLDTAGITPPIQFDTAITIACSSTATGGAAPGTTLLANTDYL